MSEIRANSITDAAGTGAPNFPNGLVVSAGNVGIGTASPGVALDVVGTGTVAIEVTGTTSAVLRAVSDTTGTATVALGDTDDIFRGGLVYDNTTDSLAVHANNAERMTILSSGNVGIGTDTPEAPLHVVGGDVIIEEANDGGSTAPILIMRRTSTTPADDDYIGSITFQGVDDALADQTYARIIAQATDVTAGTEDGALIFWTTGAGTSAERARIDGSGNMGIGTASPGAKLDLTGGNAGLGILAATNRLRFTDTDPTLVADQTTGSVEWYTSDTDNPGVHAYIGTLGSNTGAAALTFGTGVGGSATERARIDSSGVFSVGCTALSTTSTTDTGAQVGPSGVANFFRSGGTSLIVMRQTNDGTLVDLRQGGTSEGTISVSGTTVSYNGGHLSRWAQFPDNSRPELLKGTVMSNLDQMANWDQEDNEQLNCVQVSAVEGDANVAGVFVAWDSTDDGYNDILLAMTGDMVIRIAGGTTVQRGDLLMSAGDGTAKPQGDDIVRAKTIAKVTSTHVSHTYADGSYAVPCVLMAC